MKKIFLTFVLALAFTATYGQNKWQQKQNKHFVDAAAKEYNLTEKQQKELTDYRTAMVLAFAESNKQEKNGAITTEEKKAKNKEASKAFNNAIIKLTNKTYQELNPFLARMRKELKNL